MVFDLDFWLAKCSSRVHPITLQAIIKTESNKNPLAIGLNDGFSLRHQPRDIAQAIRWVNELEDQGRNIDIGLGQINIKNIHHYGLHGRDALNPCINIQLMEKILLRNYQNAEHKSQNLTKITIYQAISAYNTGNFHSGFNNQYVWRVVANSRSK